MPLKSRSCGRAAWPNNNGGHPSAVIKWALVFSILGDFPGHGTKRRSSWARHFKVGYDGHDPELSRRELSRSQAVVNLPRALNNVDHGRLILARPVGSKLEERSPKGELFSARVVIMDADTLYVDTIAQRDQ